MKPRTIILLPVIILILLFVIGWFILRISPGDTQPSTIPQEVMRPEWFDSFDDNLYIHTYGEAERANEVESYNAAEEEAISKAPVSIELYIFELIAAITQDSVEFPPRKLERINSMVNLLAQKAFPGSSITERDSYLSEQGTYVTFVRYEIPVEEVNRSFVDMVREDDDLYALMQQSEVFQELTAE